MDNLYDFSWLAQDIDDCMIISLYSRDGKILGNYQVSSVLSSDMEDLNVKFANVRDLQMFLLHGVVRFSSITNANDIIDIPVRKLYLLHKNENGMASGSDKRIKLSELEAFAVFNEEVLDGEYQTKVSSYGEFSDDLLSVSNISKDFVTLGMQNRIDALSKINIINYHRNQEKLVPARK